MSRARHAPVPAPAPAPAPAVAEVKKTAPKIKPVNIRLLSKEGLDIQGCGKNKSEQDVKLPILWKTVNLTGQQKSQLTNFIIGDKDFKQAMTVAKKPGPFQPSDGKKGSKIQDPNKWSMLVRVSDPEMIDLLSNLDKYIKEILREKDLLSDYGVTPEGIETSYKPFLFDMGSGSYAFNTNFNIVDKEFSDAVKVTLLVYEKDPKTGEVVHRAEEASPHDIRAGDSVYVLGGFDGIRIDKMSAATAMSMPRIGFKHYASQIIIVRDEEEMDDEEEEEEEDLFLAAVVGGSASKKPSVGSKRARVDDEDAAAGDSDKADGSSFFKR